MKFLQKMDTSELSVPEGWMVEKDEQGIESFLSPDGTSLPSRRLISQFCIQTKQSLTMDHLLNRVARTEQSLHGTKPSNQILPQEKARKLRQFQLLKLNKTDSKGYFV